MVLIAPVRCWMRRVGEDGIREKGGERLSFVMLNRGGSTDRIGIAEVIQAQLKGVGVEVTFQTLESAAWTQRWRSGEWEGMVTAWWLPADPSITGLYACDGPNNMTKFCNQELDELMLRSDRLLDLEQRKAALGEAQELLAKLGVCDTSVVPQRGSRSYLYACEGVSWERNELR